MTLGRVLAVSILTSAATSVATFLALRALTGPAREVQVPSVGGLRLDDARALLESRSLLLVISDTAPDPKLEPGRVVRQSPPAGSGARAGAEVRVVLSAGQVVASSPPPGQRVARDGAVAPVLSVAAPSAVKVPSLLGRTRAQATKLLEAAGLRLGRVSFGYDADRRAGVVIRQAPAAEAPAARGRAVNLVINEGD
jgi:eukaryotic-like serine/threonine-protein kinase